MDEIDKTKVDEAVKSESFMAKNMRVKPAATTKERLRTVESPLNSKRSFHESETIEIEPEKDNSKNFIVEEFT